MAQRRRCWLIVNCSARRLHGQRTIIHHARESLHVAAPYKGEAGGESLPLSSASVCVPQTQQSQLQGSCFNNAIDQTRAMFREDMSVLTPVHDWKQR